MFTRIVSGVIGIAVAAWLVHLGGVPFLITVMALTAIGLLEFYRMVAKKGIRPFRVVGILAGLIIVGMAYFSSMTLTTVTMIIPALVLALFLVFSIQLHKFGTEDAIRNVGITFFGIFYVAGLMAHFVLLRNIDNPILPGEFAIWLALICTWSTDSCAYFVGRSMGKRPLAPKISPKKTIAGFLGGLVGGSLAGFIYSIVIQFDPVKAAIIGLGIAFVGQIGDLFESALKRDAGVKDSGNLIPGHGGALDRFDSTMFTIPLTFYFIIYFL